MIKNTHRNLFLIVLIFSFLTSCHKQEKPLKSTHNILVSSILDSNGKINIDSFDIEKVDFMLNNFMSVYEKIKELEAKFNE